jgi:sensor c-di-GMP phosphodiesterase-like protein
MRICTDARSWGPERVRKYERILIAAVVGGALLAGLPIVVVDRVVNSYVDHEARARLEQGAQTSLGVAETRIEQAMMTLVDLAGAGVDSCSPAALQAMRRAVFSNAALKEVALLDAAGNMLCNHIGGIGETRAVSAEQPLLSGRYSLALVRFRDHSERALRLNLMRAGGGALSVLIAGEALLPAPEATGPRFRLALANGDVIATRPPGEENARTVEGLFVNVRATSSRFPLDVMAERSRAAIADEYDRVLVVARLTPTLISFFVIALSWLTIRRNRVNPRAMLARALDAGEIIPYYQPIVDITSGRLCGAEVLVRWRRANGTILLPGAFLSYAERSELIYELTRLLMRKARDEVGEAYEPRPHLKLSFNLDGGHFLDGQIVEEVKRTFSGSPIGFGQLIFEVTEREPVADFVNARRVISELQKLGCRVAIDDVGTGHGGLSYLLKLGVDYIKIDKMFIQGIGTERYSKTIIETLVELARNMGIEIIAEGVETFDQIEYLRAKGIETAQGYVFAPPLPASSFLALLEAMDKPRSVVTPVAFDRAAAN